MARRELERAEVRQHDPEQARVAERLEQCERALVRAARGIELIQLVLAQREVAAEIGEQARLVGALEQRDRSPISLERRLQLAVVVRDRSQVAEAARLVDQL